VTAPRLIVVAYAVAPGPGGPESQVNLELLRALAEHWPAGVTVISGGSPPMPPILRDGTPLASLPGWRVHALGESGARPGEIAVRSLRRGGLPALPARAVERLIHRRTGQGIKMASWQSAASRVLERELDLDPDAVVWSRALPFASIAAVDAVRRRRRFRWIVNVNDPLPASVWPGLYASDPVTDRRTRERFEAALPRIDALTFPSAALRDLEVAAIPALARLPSEILPHIAGFSASAPAPPSGRLRIVFGGTLRKDRARPELAEALARIGERVADLDLTFVLARPTPFAESYAASLPLSPIPARVVVEEDESALARALSGADLLLDLECEADRPLLLTKVVNYLAAGRPIWALCAPGGTTWSLVGSGWGYASALGDVDGTAATLLRILDDRSRGALAGRSPSPELAERFSPRRQAGDLLRLLGRLSP
jgi:glycosyltransferase involved in cell wall biosynthesis